MDKKLQVVLERFLEYASLLALTNELDNKIQEIKLQYTDEEELQEAMDDFNNAIKIIYNTTYEELEKKTRLCNKIQASEFVERLYCKNTKDITTLAVKAKDLEIIQSKYTADMCVYWYEELLCKVDSLYYDELKFRGLRPSLFY